MRTDFMIIAPVRVGGGAEAPIGTSPCSTESRIEFGTGLVFSKMPSSGSTTMK